MYQNKIKHLEEAHRVLDKQIDSMERTGIYDDLKIDEMKKQRLRLKDDIVILKHKHQAVMQEAQAQQQTMFSFRRQEYVQFLCPQRK